MIRPHVPPPAKVVDVMLTMPDGVMVPLNVTVQFALRTPLDNVVAPVTENGSPFGFIGWPSTRETVTASAGVAATVASASATARDTTLRVLIYCLTRTDGGNRLKKAAGNPFPLDARRADLAR
ncbi:hypothetical protein CO705_05495 [Ralstonia pickettii]|nr:hypothetical protein CO705_05495 [Ralstonia pickettii]